ncbi:MAG: DUF1579 family protein [Planctomycetota bacterium]|jgi:hypothetical protein
MRTDRIVVVALVAAAAFALGRAGVPDAGGQASAAQEPPGDAAVSKEMRAVMKMARPGRHHRVLDRLVGKWTGEFSLRSAPDAEPVTFRGTVTRRWVLGRRFIEERVEAESPMGPFRGVGYLGYNNFDQQYETVWMETGSTAIKVDKGTLHGDQMLMHMRSEHRDPVTGRVVYSWGKMDFSDADRHLYHANVTSPDGTTYRSMEGVLVRQATDG